MNSSGVFKTFDRIMLSFGALTWIALLFAPVLYSFPLYVLLFFALGIYSYVHYKDDYAPGGNWIVLAFIIAGAANVLEVLLYFFFPSSRSIDHIVGRVIQWTSIAVIMYWSAIQPQTFKKKKKWTELSNAELLWCYVWYARSFGKDINSEEDKTKEVDQEFGATSSIYLELKKRGKASMLEKLLIHKNNAVRALAARYLYWTDKERSLRIMEEVGTHGDGLGNTMRIWVQACREGKILPDPI